jgi:hypothetical protein
VLDDVMNAVKLRQFLWESTDQWEKQVDEWTTVDFNHLIPEDMNLFTAKNVKNILIFEKGLPPNLIVSKFSQSVEAMKQKVSVILSV